MRGLTDRVVTRQTSSGGSYPLYHTLYETYYMVTELQDRGLHFSAAVTQMWGEMARRWESDGDGGVRTGHCDQGVGRKTGCGI